MPNFNDYFTRNLESISREQLELLQLKRVAVVGCGGLGGYVIEELARIGIGHLHLFDPDTFSESNCNRQLNALMATMGQRKAEVAATRVASIHPYCQTQTFCADFRDVDAKQSFAVDLVVDCLDDIPARRDLSTLCKRHNLPLIHGAVNGWYGQVGVQHPGGNLIEQLYPLRRDQSQQLPAPSVLSFTVALVASLQAAEAVKALLGLETLLSSGWLYIDLKENDYIYHEL
ncbi:HesA/MoeB/ThiF family protein [Desulfobulbus rhabdoformis]|jgi:molybdopterin/thiamine biosynthesis adenylyltransferase|uniref:HesA/MoeB/ThiF family protein n=1 Tax=Desulfobulbus rhabdoformis TaxID=34032 RepID=UPI0019668016|nr:HesA/MoeB/ThiF family protein [Desulfobulbus rhabdoformis]MBM9616357.1 HesA/MoeB/ThiF family protein [Desulfobulbus rhabdoformis]